jgi:hypothetical protein
VTFPSLALNAAGEPRISYHEWNRGALLYAVRATGVWQTEPVDEPAGVDVGRYSSLAIDPQSDASHIGYFDISSRVLKYAVSTGQRWATSVADSNGDVGRYARLALDPSGGVHISYYDATTYALKYALLLKPKPPKHGKEIAISPHQFPYKVTVETKCAESLAGVCLREKLVRTCIGGNCFDLTQPVPEPRCTRCELAISALIGLTIGIAATGTVWLARRRRP